MEDGKKQLLSPTELKKKILKILNFNEPVNPRSKSVIYRYAVFTPQEEMKSILTKSDDERLNTIRKALRLDEYKNARDNCKLLKNLLNTRYIEYKSKVEGLDELKNKYKKKWRS